MMKLSPHEDSDHEVVERASLVSVRQEWRSRLFSIFLIFVELVVVIYCLSIRLLL
ncbi:hypothetical protein M433DRAFT_159535 [Acidomyces richmondensis BFW]|nr:MAG: hypothetical protein FE78DRAFT_90576 [Acidomyces sp. 'richmondensis']KYG41045.1 hypothetical protein M433DRAFT_159535 [Acidomyces richmondensis BFW]